MRLDRGERDLFTRKVPGHPALPSQAPLRKCQQQVPIQNNHVRFQALPPITTPTMVAVFLFLFFLGQLTTRGLRFLPSRHLCQLLLVPLCSQ